VNRVVDRQQILSGLVAGEGHRADLRRRGKPVHPAQQGAVRRLDGELAGVITISPSAANRRYKPFTARWPTNPNGRPLGGRATYRSR